MKSKIHKQINKPDSTLIEKRVRRQSTVSRALITTVLALSFSILSVANAQAGSREFNVTIKSFIKPIDMGNLGSFRRCAFGRCIPKPAKNARLRTFAEATRAAFNENPWHTRKDEKYRVYSNLKINAECQGNRLRITRSFLSSDVGKDGPLKPPAAIGRQEKELNNNVYKFKWYLRARPAPATEPAFLAVGWRTNPYIWQKMGGKVFCENGQPRLITNVFEGSKFPSHRYWINGQAKHSKQQGQLTELWKLDRPSL